MAVDEALKARYRGKMPAAANLPTTRTPTPLPSFLLILAAWLLPALLSGVNTFMQSRLEAEAADWHWVLFNSADWLLYAALTPFVFRASRRWPLEKPHWVSHLVTHVTGALAMCIVWAGLGTLLRLVIFPEFAHSPGIKIVREFESWIFTTLPFGVGVYFALVGIERSLFYLTEARQGETRAARLSAQLAEARLGALRMQLNPHFLFNSLNAILVLVRDQNTKTAERMLELLGDVLRQVLNNTEGHETTLTAELDFVEHYLAIEQVRFSDRLRIRIEAPPEILAARLPHFLLQPLIENALRHGVATRESGGEVHITGRREGVDLVLTVGDNGPGFVRDLGTGGVGLANTRARLYGLYADQASLTIVNLHEGGVEVTVRLPYHESVGNA